MTAKQLRDALDFLAGNIDKVVSGVTDAATAAQEQVYEAILKTINNFEINDGRFITDQDYTARLAALTRKIESVLGDIYAPSLSAYLGEYQTIEKTVVSLHKSYNDLEVEVSKLSPTRKVVYDQAKYYLSDGLADAYIQPAKYLVMQQVTNGMSIRDSERLLRRWNNGELTPGELPSNRPTPNLQMYATQIARDSAYQYSGAIQEIIKDEYGLEKFIYTGDIVEDTRPICKHLVLLKRDIELTEIPALITRFPQGLYPNTSKKNFINVRGGYNCRHQAFPVR